MPISDILFILIAIFLGLLRFSFFSGTRVNRYSAKAFVPFKEYDAAIPFHVAKCKCVCNDLASHVFNNRYSTNSSYVIQKKSW